MKKFEISEEDMSAISAQIVIIRTVNLTSFREPFFYLNAGQPGSGKTELNNLTRRSHDDDILECNADTLRDYHPDVVEILREHEADYPDITWPPASQWNSDLVRIGQNRGYNILIETTLHNLDLALNTLKDMKSHGYQTHLQVLAVPYRWSWLGIHLRFESMKAITGVGRLVSQKDHDDRFRKLSDNLPKVVESPHLDFASLYARRLHVAANAGTALELMTDNKSEIEPRFRSIVDAKMSDEKRQEYQRETDRVVQLMKARGVEEDRIQDFQRFAKTLSA